MIAPYRRILARPGALAFSSAGFFARMPMAMSSLGLVILVEDTTGSYGIAGATVGAYGLSAAAAGPFVARLVDRLGQARVIRRTIVIHAIGYLLLIAGALLAAPTWVLLLTAVLAGLPQGSMGSLVRARWSYVLGSGEDGKAAPDLHTAFSLESVLDEVVFIFGPILVTVLATQANPAAGCLLAVSLAVTGTLVLASLRGSEPPPRPRDPAADRQRSVLALPGVLVVAAVLTGAGGVFGSTEVSVVAFTEERGVPGQAGVLLALWALGSLVAGLLYGATTWRGRDVPRFLAAVTFFAVCMSALPLVSSVPMLAVMALATGASISPVIIGAYALIERLVPAERLTEGLTWATTGLSVSYAASAALAGRVIDLHGAGAGFFVATGSAVFGLLAAVAGYQRLNRSSRYTVPQST